jgi:hypothetical protein
MAYTFTEPAMASEAQIAANRRNALKSTGPSTPRGKAAVSRNALRHGLTAERIVCFDETEAGFAAFAAGLRAALAPADPVEAQLAERIAFDAWRLRRVYRVEADLFNAFRATPPFQDTGIATVFDRAAMRMTALSRYETALDRGVHRACHAGTPPGQAPRRAPIATPCRRCRAGRARSARSRRARPGRRIGKLRNKANFPCEIKKRWRQRRGHSAHHGRRRTGPVSGGCLH